VQHDPAQPARLKQKTTIVEVITQPFDLLIEQFNKRVHVVDAGIIIPALIKRRIQIRSKLIGPQFYPSNTLEAVSYNCGAFG
jgi:hypothetical protein